MPDLGPVSDNFVHACFGLKAFQACDYDPAKPYAIYFGPGASVRALAFTLTVQQLLKPVYRFRLTVRRAFRLVGFISASLRLFAL